MMKGLHTWMGQRTAVAPNCSDWVKSKSLGRAYMPSEDLKAFIIGAEGFFNKVNGDTLTEVKDPIMKVATLLKKARPDISGDIIEAYSKARFFRRLGDLNLKEQVHELNIRRKNAIHKNKYIAKTK